MISSYELFYVNPNMILNIKTSKPILSFESNPLYLFKIIFLKLNEHSLSSLIKLMLMNYILLQHPHRKHDLNLGFIFILCLINWLFELPHESRDSLSKVYFNLIDRIFLKSSVLWSISIPVTTTCWPQLQPRQKNRQFTKHILVIPPRITLRGWL